MEGIIQGLQNQVEELPEQMGTRIDGEERIWLMMIRVRKNPTRLKFDFGYGFVSSYHYYFYGVESSIVILELQRVW